MPWKLLGVHSAGMDMGGRDLLRDEQDAGIASLAILELSASGYLAVGVERGGEVKVELPKLWWFTDIRYRQLTVDPRVYFESRPLTEAEKGERGERRREAPAVLRLRRNLRSAAEAAGHEPPAITTVQRVGFRLDSPVAFAPGTARAAAGRTM